MVVTPGDGVVAVHYWHLVSGGQPPQQSVIWAQMCPVLKTRHPAIGVLQYLHDAVTVTQSQMCETQGPSEVTPAEVWTSPPPSALLVKPCLETCTALGISF